MIKLQREDSTAGHRNVMDNIGNTHTTISESQVLESPFCLDSERAYLDWRARKLANYPTEVRDLFVDIRDPHALSVDELKMLTQVCGKTNTVFYRCQQAPFDAKLVRVLGHQLGLHNLDGNLCSDEDNISALRVMPDGSRHEGYIPYTDRPINWHTDGYYNSPDRKIRAMILHCVNDAASGGTNQILDHEIVYILVRDHDPALVEALMAPDAMTIPANVENGVKIRDAESGPVFSVDPVSGNLHMRYTARKRSIVWRSDKATAAWVAFLEDLFSRGCDYIYQYRLLPGEGVISNNALHNRTGFVDDADKGKTRLIYRARYYDRVMNTDLHDLYYQE